MTTPQRAADNAVAGNGRLPDADPIGVLDIGSNSIRLVVYERHARALTPLYNEKASAALGRGLAASGRISDKAFSAAIRAITRFALVRRVMRVQTLYILATSATREAANGARFVAEVERVTGTAVRILSGAEEAHYSALGVVAGIPGFSGVVGDLGGGSLELAALIDDRDSLGETHALGAIRLQDDSGRNLAKAQDIVRERLSASDLLKSAKGDFCAIGGTWRAIAKLEQVRTQYPLHMVQHYTIPADEALALCRDIVAAFTGKKQMLGIRSVSSSRRDLLPFGAVVLGEALRAGSFDNAVFSALGLREGFLFGLLDEAEQAVDPLLQAAREMSQLRARSPLHADELIGLSERYVAAMGLAETAEDRRLRIAACLMSDIGWRGHPDYRGEQSVDLVAFGSLIGLDHPGRAFLAEVLAVRYMGLKHKSVSAAIMTLAGDAASRRARQLGAMFRVAYPMSAGMPGILPRVDFAYDGECLTLKLPKDLEFIAGDRLPSRLSQLAEVAGARTSAIGAG